MGFGGRNPLTTPIRGVYFGRRAFASHFYGTNERIFVSVTSLRWHYVRSSGKLYDPLPGGCRRELHWFLHGACRTSYGVDNGSCHYHSVRRTNHTMSGGITTHWSIGSSPVPMTGRVGIISAYCHRSRGPVANSSNTIVITTPTDTKPVMARQLGRRIHWRDCTMTVPRPVNWLRNR